MSDEERIGESGQWRGKNLSGHIIDYRNVTIQPNGDVWEDGAFKGNAYEIDKQNAFPWPSSSDDTGGSAPLRATGGITPTIPWLEAIRKFVVTLILLGIIYAVGSMLLGQTKWFKDITGETAKETAEAEVQANSHQQSLDRIRATERYQLLQRRFKTQEEADVALIQQNINMLYALDRQAQRFGEKSRLHNDVSGPVKVTGELDSDTRYNAYRLCYRGKYGRDDCHIRTADDIERHFILTNAILNKVARHCHFEPSKGTPGCVKAFNHLGNPPLTD